MLYNLASAAYCMGKVEEAEQSMQRFLALAPNSTRSGEARLFLEMGALVNDVSGSQTARSDIDKVLKADPKFLPALMAQAALLTTEGQS